MAAACTLTETCTPAQDMANTASSDSPISSKLPQSLHISPKRSCDTVVDGTDSGYATAINSPSEPASGQDGTKSHHGTESTSDVPRVTLFAREKKKVNLYRDMIIPEATRNRFHDLVELLHDPLYAYLTRRGLFRKQCGQTVRYSFRLLMMGESEDKAMPFIFVQCEDFLWSRVRDFFNKRRVKEHCQPSNSDSAFPNFKLYVSDKPPVHIAITLPVPVWLRQGNAKCSDLVVFKAFNNSPYRYATLGGVIKVNYESKACLYGLTVRHIFDEELSGTDAQTSTQMSGSGVDKPGPLYSDLDSEDDEDTGVDDMFLWQDNQEYELHETENSDKTVFQTVSVLELVEDPLESPDGSAMVPGVDLPASSRKLDWALIVLDDKESFDPLLARRPQSHLSSAPIPDHQTEQEVFVEIAAAVTGRTYGRLSLSSSYIMMGTNGELVKTHTLRAFDESIFKPGDCGAWVVDMHTKVVYGYLVASDALGDAYVVSMDDTLQNIRSTLGADSVIIYHEGTVACTQLLSEGNQAELESSDADLTEPELSSKFDHESRIPDSGYASKMPSAPTSPTSTLGLPPGPGSVRVLLHREDQSIRMGREDIVTKVEVDDSSSISSEDDRSVDYSPGISAYSRDTSYSDNEEDPRRAMLVRGKCQISAGITFSSGPPIYGKEKPGLPPRTSSHQQSFVTALYNFDGQGEGDLPFKKGDRILVVTRTDSTDDWWQGELRGVKGAFPANYCL